MAFLTNLFAVLKGLYDAIVGAIARYKQAKKEGWIADQEIVYDAIEKAKSDTERRELAKRLADVVRNSPL